MLKVSHLLETNISGIINCKVTIHFRASWPFDLNESYEKTKSYENECVYIENVKISDDFTSILQYP